MPYANGSDRADGRSPLGALKAVIREGEAWLMERVLHYARRQDFTKYTSTLAQAWRTSIAGLSDALLEACDAYDSAPELGPDDDYIHDPIAAFGILEAQRHRTRGITLAMFLGLLKYYRQSYVDLLLESRLDSDQRECCRLFIERAFDRIEIGFTTKWQECSEEDRLKELQDSNRRMTNEKNKYLTIFESLHDPAILLDTRHRIANINHAGMTLLRGVGVPGASYYRGQETGRVLPWLREAIERCEESGSREVDFEKRIRTVQGVRVFHVKLQRMLDVSDKFSGTIVLLNDITKRKRAERRLGRYADALNARNRLLEDELTLARDVQQSFMPRQYPCYPRGVAPAQSLLRFYDLYRPATILGGDFFDVLELSDRQAGVMICDVTGHGAEAALVTAVLRGLLHEHRPAAGDPGRLLTEVNRGLVEILQRPFAPILTTAFYLTVDTSTGQIRYARAGHPSPVWMRRRESRVDRLPCEGDVSGPALGLLDDFSYSTGPQLTVADDLVVLFTDGLFEVEGRDGNLYGETRLEQAVGSRMELPPEELFRALIEDVRSYSRHGVFADDICLVGMEVRRT